MKSIMLSIRPKWVAKILNGEKTIEVRKVFPKGYQGWVYIYCTKDKNECLIRNNISKTYRLGTCYWDEFESNLNGKVVARFYCDKVERIHCCCVPYKKENNLGYETCIDNGVYKVEWKENVNLKDEEKRFNEPSIYKNDAVVFEREDKYIDTMLKNEDFNQMCLTPQMLLDYVALGNSCYVIHITKLEIFDRPKELSEFSECVLSEDLSHDNIVHIHQRYKIIKAPQNYRYVEVEEK